MEKILANDSQSAIVKKTKQFLKKKGIKSPTYKYWLKVDDRTMIGCKSKKELKEKRERYENSKEI